jgi:hypothetical protein
MGEDRTELASAARNYWSETHFTEPPDIFTSRAPAKLQDKG